MTPLQNNHTHSETVRRIITLTAPFIAVGIVIAVLALVLSWDVFTTLTALMATSLAPAAGKESIIPIGMGLGVPWWALCISFIAIDTAGGALVTYNWDFTHKIPYLGTFFKKLTNFGEEFLAEHKIFERLSVLGLIIFVALPLQGSGGFGGSILARLLSIPKAVTVICIFIGSALSSLTIAFGTAYISSILPYDPAVISIAAGTIILIAALIGLICFSARKKLRRRRI